MEAVEVMFGKKGGLGTGFISDNKQFITYKEDKGFSTTKI